MKMTIIRVHNAVKSKWHGLFRDKGRNSQIPSHRRASLHKGGSSCAVTPDFDGNCLARSPGPIVEEKVLTLQRFIFTMPVNSVVIQCQVSVTGERLTLP